MKTVTKIIPFFLTVCLFLGLMPAAWAEESAEDYSQYEDRTPDDIMAELFETYQAKPEDVHAGYCNLVTGEEYYWQGDELTITASMHKLPLNMYYAELMKTGELVWEERFPDIPYDGVLEETIIYSNNDWTTFLIDGLGGYDIYRRAIAPYMGVDPDTVDPVYFTNNLFSPRQMIHCLKLLYDEPERFPKIIETIKKAEPERFFKLNERRFDIGHKYGYVPEPDDGTYMNDCGLAFTDEPIALVMFTKNVYQAEELLGAYCTAMCEYTQYHAALRREGKEPGASEVSEEVPEPTETPAPTRQPEPTPVREEAAAAVENDTEVSPISLPVIPCILIVLLTVAAVIYFAAGKRKYGIKPFWMIVAVLIAAFALLLCAVGLEAGTVYAKPEGDPGAVAEAFMDALVSGSYPEAYTYLKDYSDLGLDEEPETDTGKKIYDALRGSFEYALIGPCRTNKLEAAQTVSFRYLDLEKLQGDLSAEETVDEITHGRPRDEIYDENDEYRQEIIDEAYTVLIDDALTHVQDYYSQTEFDLELAYSDGRWQVVLKGSPLLEALTGGTGGNA